eukprot:TRINITY_DN7636_c0_g1_i2.p1 TRINITY_DN7636_c0_g1~~TRINITY_DN7636_c0_g1_i2.p1  ORF type:complete len:202 (-),score=52.98 TRINITY_DN7636_c0_g1_i2:156-689(-)
MCIRDRYQHVPPVKIDDEGRFKYIIINAFLTLDGRKKTGDMIQFIRGTARKAYHPDIFEEFVEEVVAMPLEFKFVQDEKEVVKKAGSILRFECPGGGRIEHSAQNQKVFVYGYSQTYGPGKHEVAIEFLKKAYPTYPESNFTFSYDGYQTNNIKEIFSQTYLLFSFFCCALLWYLSV